MRYRPPLLEVARRFRKNPTPAERYAWRLLRGRRMLGLRFRRQHSIGPFVVDFYCAELKLVLELDGKGHTDASVASYDAARTDWLTRRGYHVRRITNRAISPESLRTLVACVATGAHLSSPLSTRQRGEGDRG